MKKPLFKLGFMVGLYNGLMVIYKMGYIYTHTYIYIYTHICAQNKGDPFKKKSGCIIYWDTGLYNGAIEWWTNGDQWWFMIAYDDWCLLIFIRQQPGVSIVLSDFTRSSLFSTFDYQMVIWWIYGD